LHFSGMLFMHGSGVSAGRRQAERFTPGFELADGFCSTNFTKTRCMAISAVAVQFDLFIAMVQRSARTVVSAVGNLSQVEIFPDLRVTHSMHNYRIAVISLCCR